MCTQILKALLHWLQAFCGADEKPDVILILDLLYVTCDNVNSYVGTHKMEASPKSWPITQI